MYLLIPARGDAAALIIAVPPLILKTLISAAPEHFFAHLTVTILKKALEISAAFVGNQAIHLE